MPLRITLRPHERIMIGRTSLVNGAGPADFTIGGKRAPILRGREIMEDAEANTPCKKLYVAIQSEYLDSESDIYKEHYIICLIKEILLAAPSLRMVMSKLSYEFLLGDHYKALAACRSLIKEEAFLLSASSNKVERQMFEKIH